MNQTSDPEVRREAHSIGDTVVRDDIIQKAGDYKRWSEDLGPALWDTCAFKRQEEEPGNKAG